MRIRQPNLTMPLSELRRQIHQHKQEGRKLIQQMKVLQSHHEKMQEYYEEWENELKRIDDAIHTAAVDHCIPPKEVEEFDPLDDLLGAK